MRSFVIARRCRIAVHDRLRDTADGYSASFITLVATICSAIGHHDEKTAFPVNAVSAALILSDKSDVRRTRVRKDAIIASDIHDRVNYAVENASLKIDAENKLCVFSVTIDTNICPVMEYFEIFLDRMVLCRKAADFLGLTFELIINETRLL